MMKSYVKFLSRNKLYATIEALGLSVALAFVLILVSYATAEYRVGTNQKLAKELYVAGSGDYLGMTWGIAKEFFPSIPEIKGWTRFGEYYTPQGAMIDGQYYEAKYLAIDPNFSQFMGYKCRGCAPDHLLSDAHQAMVSESFAKKAFGNANPIGRTIQCGKLQLKVVGIMEDFDREDLLNPYDIFVSMKLIEAEAQPMNQFGSCTTVARLAKEADPEKVRLTLLGKYINYWKEWKKESGGADFMWGCQFVRWDQIHFADDDVEIFKHGNRSLVNILLVVALVLLLSALFNYINLTVAQIGNRAKEMATRRLLGESVGGVMLRYLKESALFTAVCFLLGLLISWAFIPLFNSMLDTKIDLFHSFDLLWFLPLAYVIISIFAGILPAIVVSESRFAIHHYTDEVYEIFCKGLGVDSSIFITDVDALGDEAILQVTPFCTVEQEALLMPTLANCTSGRWHPAFTDITARGADKGKGLHAMADYLGLNIEETMAFGDGGNDISIIKEAGVGVAMGNAGEELKLVADYITTHVDEDGVKNALIKYGVI